jgi:hypothetical protein
LKRPAQPALSGAGGSALSPYVRQLYDEQDLSAATRRNYLSDLRQFAAWCEYSWAEGQDELGLFAPTSISTPMITMYRSYLQTVVGLRPAIQSAPGQH